jgi:hypothetical protein
MGMQTTGKTRMTWRFFSRGWRTCQHASPRCVDRSLSSSAANWHHPPSPHVGHRKNLPTSEGSSMTRSTSVALCGSRWWAWYPWQILLRSTAQSSCVLHDGELTTKPSRRWQPPRVTSSTGLQLEHLVPLDAIPQCNTLKSLTRNRIKLLQAQVS